MHNFLCIDLCDCKRLYLGHFWLILSKFWLLKIVCLYILGILSCSAELSAGNNYGFAAGCVYTDPDGCEHDYYILYNKDDFDEIVFVADEDESELFTYMAW